ncbi:MAG: tRNA (adenosine(37)-N6)-dimethylallyltransferase MiaA [Bacilli bacterium]|nr:tRNA (adenosine(37)-N6)-dimethylallyltransferase MiaA [Bacilli bacterium]
MIFVIGGVTASGKSDLAFTFAKKVNGIIINADAFAFYRELNIGTAKPSKEELESVPTFLFNNLKLDDKYSIYDYQQDARRLIKKYETLKKPIIFVGGSGLYIRAALYNYELKNEDAPEIKDDPTISNLTLHSELANLDYEASLKIHPNNRKRVLRALAIVKAHKTKKSDIDNKANSNPLYPFIMVNLDAPKVELEKRIEARTKKMFQDGLRAEVQGLLGKYIENVQGLQAIGYKEILQNPDETDDFLMSLISLRTRQYAKRQRTFFRNQFTGIWFTDKDAALKYLLEKYEELKV